MRVDFEQIYCYFVRLKPNPERLKSLFSSLKSLLLSPYFHVPFLGLAFLIFAWNQTLAVFPDVFGLGSREEIRDILNVMISTTAEVIGITIAVLVVAFELFRQKIGISAFRYFQKNRFLAYLIATNLTCILISFTNLLLLPEHLNTPKVDHLSVLYLNIWVWFGTLGVLFPLVFKIIKTLNLSGIIDYEISRIHEHIPTICPNKTDTEGFDFLKELENDPTNLLQNIALRHVASGERYIPQYINWRITEKLTALAISTDDYHEARCHERLVKYYETIVEEAIRTPNQAPTLGHLWSCVEYVNEEYAKHSKMLSKLENLNIKFFEKYLDRLAKHEQQEAVIEGIETKERIVKIHLEASAHESEIQDLWLIWKNEFEVRYGKKESKEFDFQKSMNFKMIVEDLFGSFEKYARIAVKYGNEEMLRRILSILNFFEISYNKEQVTPLKQALISLDSSLHICSIYCMAYEQRFLKKSYEAWYILPDFTLRQIKRPAPFYLKIIVRNFCGWVEFMLENDLVDDNLLGKGAILGSKISTLYYRLAESLQTEGDILIRDCLEVLISTYKKSLENLRKMPEKNDRFIYQAIEALKELREMLSKKDESISGILISQIDEILGKTPKSTTKGRKRKAKN